MDDAPAHVLLLHGMGCGPWVWRDVMAHLSPALIALPVVVAGHRGGTRLQRTTGRSAPELMVDDLETQLDAMGIRRLHVVGNSLGGWLAMRLAERGRALSVLALAPAGGWHAGSAGERLIVSRFVLGHHAARSLSRRPSLLSRPRLRHAVLAPVVHKPELVSTEGAVSFVKDLAECQALRAALGNPDARRLSLIRGTPVPSTIAWSREDRVLSGPWARAGFRHLDAEVIEMTPAGHLPMVDQPRAVAALVERRISEAQHA